MLLLPQLVQIWLPDNSPSHLETDRELPNEPTPRSQIPPLISFLNGLPDVPMPDETKGKRFPCGHVPSVGSILECSNLFGDRRWTPAPHLFTCGQPGCDEVLEFPKIPDPRVLDGLRARLDLIQWSWNEDAPTKGDVETVGLLRDMLAGIAHESQEEPEPAMDTDDDDRSQNEPTDASSLKRTLHLMETEAFKLMVLRRARITEASSRGSEPYCRYRDATVARAGDSYQRYPMASPGQYCECDTPHEEQREAGSWGLTPAETPCDADADEPSEAGENAATTRRGKAVRFVAPVVTRVRYFTAWWCDEYRDSARYWSTGPHRCSVDGATEEDDEWEIEMLEAEERRAAAAADGDGDDGGSDCSTAVGDEEEEEEADDEEVLDEMERAHEGFEEELVRDLGELKNLHEEWQEWF